MLDVDPAKAWTPREVLAVAFRHPPEFPPDASYDHCNTNCALLGLIAEKAGGRPLAQQFQDRPFGPLGLRRTSLPAAADSSMPDRFSHGYMYGGSSYALVDKPYPPELQAAARTGKLPPVDCTAGTPRTPPPPAASSPRRTTCPHGSGHWSRGRS
ncbi:serine hydrolase [Streptomyces mirabilis]|uniref:serine hydrolase n=1 Tax=Streptomyces mirabilis TaxID=68239 RepID=UPI0034E93B14